MCDFSCILWSIALAVVTVPWTAATLLSWIYTEAFEPEPQTPTEPKVGWVIAILQTTSVLLYFIYISFAILFIGMVGRRSMFSFCCLAAGIPIFAVVPLVAGGAILFTALSSKDGESSGTAKGIGIAAGVTCLLSTVTCFFVLCWALICGSRGRAKEHRYPIPLAYFPFLRDFKDVKRDREVADSERYTADYPPPRYNFAERKPISESPWIKRSPKT